MTTTSNPPPFEGSLDAWLARLETLSTHEIELGLERVQELLGRLVLPRPRRVLHVAGTNGKGSTVAMLESLYRGQGCKVACYTSPHVRRFNERMRIDGRVLDDAAIVRAFDEVEAVRHGVPLTYFEFATLAALVAFAAAGADAWVLEIGLGGRLDAVNALDPDGAIITNVSLDHCDWLGADIESIAREKAGVMRAGRPAIFGATPVPRALSACAAELGADLRVRDRDYRFEVARGSWRFEGRELALDTLAPPSLKGRVQYANAAAALALYEALEGAGVLTAPYVGRAFAALELPGRLQRLDTERRWLLDVAHNPGAAAALAAELADLDAPGGITAVIGVLDDKDVEGMLEPLADHVARWVAVTADSPRAVPALSLAARIAAATSKPCRIAADMDGALDTALRLTPPDGFIVVSGSFYAVGPALKRLQPVAADPLSYTRGAS